MGSFEEPTASRRSLHRVLGKINTSVRRAFRDVCPLPLDVFRGDGWQLLVTSPVSALRVALHVRASLRVEMDSRRADTRVAIGIGSIDFLPGEEVSKGDGEAYRLSGAALDELPRQARLTVRGGSSAREHELLDALLASVDALSRRWTASQSQAILGALGGKTQETIAASWKPEEITQQAVAQHLDRASWFSVERALRAFEATVKDADNKR